MLLLLCDLVIPVQVNAGGIQNWPQNLDPYLKPTENCAKKMENCRDCKNISENDDPVIHGYVQFNDEETCRLAAFEKAFMENPTWFCPGLEVSSFSSCYSKIIDGMMSKTGLTSRGLTFMASLMINYLTKSKNDNFHSDRVDFSLIETALFHVEALDQRLRPDVFAKRFSSNKPNLIEMENLRKKDDQFASKLASKLLQLADEMMTLKALETKCGKNKFSPTRLQKSRIKDLSKKIIRLSSKWKFYKLHTKSTPNCGQSEVRKADLNSS